MANYYRIGSNIDWPRGVSIEQSGQQVVIEGRIVSTILIAWGVMARKVNYIEFDAATLEQLVADLKGDPQWLGLAGSNLDQIKNFKMFYNSILDQMYAFKLDQIKDIANDFLGINISLDHIKNLLKAPKLLQDKGTSRSFLMRNNPKPYVANSARFGEIRGYHE